MDVNNGKSFFSNEDGKMDKFFEEFDKFCSSLKVGNIEHKENYNTIKITVDNSEVNEIKEYFDEKFATTEWWHLCDYANEYHEDKYPASTDYIRMSNCFEETLYELKKFHDDVDEFDILYSLIQGHEKEDYEDTFIEVDLDNFVIHTYSSFRDTSIGNEFCNAWKECESFDDVDALFGVEIREKSR